ncbi:hypothetical protein R1sor_016073 [Riccia sorocarpa]|uniref:Uncharacterized protein n=1 Tax=Riccia sorocarpa TaxID=122646 RepID=A0ABD3HK56_9MARC
MESQISMYIVANQLQGQLLDLWLRLQILQERYLGLDVDDQGQLMDLWHRLQTLQANYLELFPGPVATYAPFDLVTYAPFDMVFPDLQRVNARFEEVLDPTSLEPNLPYVINGGTPVINLRFPNCTILVDGEWMDCSRVPPVTAVPHVIAVPRKSKRIAEKCKSVQPKRGHHQRYRMVAVWLAASAACHAAVGMAATWFLAAATRHAACPPRAMQRCLMTAAWLAAPTQLSTPS